MTAGPAIPDAWTWLVDAILLDEGARESLGLGGLGLGFVLVMVLSVETAGFPTCSRSKPVAPSFFEMWLKTKV